MLRPTLFVIASLPVFLLSAADPPTLKVLTSNGVKAATGELFPKNVVPDYDTTVSLRKKIEAGASFDLAILTVEAIDALIKEGKLTAESRRNFARTGVGVGYHKGAKKPDISSPEAFKKTLLAAKSISYNEVGASRQAIEKMLATLGIADQVKAKAIIETESGRPQMDVGSGKAELVLTLIPEIPPYENVELAGSVPEPLQSYTSFAFAMPPGGKNAAEARKLIEFFTSPAQASKVRAKGLEPLH
jgi:molybdate transport system substrate-binding protein